MKSNGDGELNWLATRYVLGELSVAEHAAFESRLADDVAACEAVASASRLVLAGQRAMSSGTVPASTSSLEPAGRGRPTPAALTRSVRGAWSVVAVASAAIAVACLFLVRSPREENSVVVDASKVVSPSPAELVSLWRSGTDSVVVEPEEIEIEPGDDDMAVPGWMLAAVSLEVRGSLDPLDPVDARDPAGKVQEN